MWGLSPTRGLGVACHRLRSFSRVCCRRCAGHSPSLLKCDVCRSFVRLGVFCRASASGAVGRRWDWGGCRESFCDARGVEFEAGTVFDFGVAPGGLAGGAGVWLWCRETLAGAGSVDGRSGATPAGRAKDPDPNRWLRSRETLAGAGSVDGRSVPIPAGRAKDPDPNRHRQTYKQTYIYPYRQTDRQTYRQPYRHADGHTYRQAACDEWVICDEGANCDEWVPCDERMTYGKWMACDE